MGLHLHTTQSYGEAEITVRGDLTGLGLAQLQAAIHHFRSRGCSVIHLNVESQELGSAVSLGERALTIPEELEFAIR